MRGVWNENPRKARKPRVCPVCGAEFTPAYFQQKCCSEPCKRARQLQRMEAYRARAGRRTAGLGKRARCVVCGRVFVSHHNRNTCSAACKMEHYRQQNRDHRERQRAREELVDMRKVRAARLVAVDMRNAEAVANTPVARSRRGDEVVETRGNCTGGGFANTQWQYIGVHA